MTSLPSIDNSLKGDTMESTTTAVEPDYQTRPAPLQLRNTAAFGECILVNLAPVADGVTVSGGDENSPQWWRVMVLETAEFHLTWIRPSASPMIGHASPATFAAMADQLLISRQATLDNVRTVQLSRDRAATALETFKGAVRAMAIKLHHEDRWCLDGMNEGLRELGLEEYRRSYRVSAIVSVTATVYADDDRSARNALRDILEGYEFSHSDEDVSDDISASVDNMSAELADEDDGEY